MIIYICLLISSKVFEYVRINKKQKCYEILLTGTFFSDEWITPFLTPLAESIYCKKILMVSERKAPDIQKVETVFVPKLLKSLFGGDISRLIVFFWVGLRSRPHFVGGFHILVNGLAAVLLGKIINAKSMYFCGGGPREIIGGGYNSSNKVFSLLSGPDLFIERMLQKTVKRFDLIITMGTSAASYFKSIDPVSNIHVLLSGFDSTKFIPSKMEKKYDVILVARLSSIKRVDRLVESTNLIREKIPDIKVAILGDGPSINDLTAMTKNLDLGKNINFLGRQKSVIEWLQQSKIFILTSDSEGVSLAMMEAMLCGLPPVVPDVGDLSDIVKSGINGYLISTNEPENYASTIIEMLSDNINLLRLSKNARKTAVQYDNKNVSVRWNDILKHF